MTTVIRTEKGGRVTPTEDPRVFQVWTGQIRLTFGDVQVFLDPDAADVVAMKIRNRTKGRPRRGRVASRELRLT